MAAKNKKGQSSIDGSLYTFKCEECGTLIKLSTRVLINAPRGMAWVPTDEKPEALRKMMINLGVLNNSGELRDLAEQQQEYRERSKEV